MPRTRILLDQNTPIGLRRLPSACEVITAASMGWEAVENGDLIQAAEHAGFAVLIICDRNIRYQQNSGERLIALIELTTNHWADIRANSAGLRAAIEAATPGSYATVTIPRSALRRRPFPRTEC